MYHVVLFFNCVIIKATNTWIRILFMKVTTTYVKTTVSSPSNK